MSEPLAPLSAEERDGLRLLLEGRWAAVSPGFQAGCEGRLLRRLVNLRMLDRLLAQVEAQEERLGAMEARIKRLQQAVGRAIWFVCSPVTFPLNPGDMAQYLSDVLEGTTGGGQGE